MKHKFYPYNHSTHGHATSLPECQQPGLTFTEDLSLLDAVEQDILHTIPSSLTGFETSFPSLRQAASDAERSRTTSGLGLLIMKTSWSLVSNHFIGLLSGNTKLGSVFCTGCVPKNLLTFSSPGTPARPFPDAKSKPVLRPHPHTAADWDCIGNVGAAFLVKSLLACVPHSVWAG